MSVTTCRPAPRRRSPWWALLIAAALPLPSVLAAEPIEPELPRRARLGVQIDASPADGLRLAAIDDDSSFGAAGILADDVLLRLGDIETPDFPALATAMSSLRAGAQVDAVLRRDGELLTVPVTLFERPREQADDILIEYGAVQADDAVLRTIVTRPLEGGPFRALMLLPGLTCYSIDSGTGPDPAFSRTMAHDLARRGFLTLRVERSGVGDSTGTPCTEIDFETEGAGDLAALRQLFARPDVDGDRVFLFGHSMGGMFGPWLAERLADEHPIAGIAVYGTGLRNWFEYMLNNQRRQMLLAGNTWSEANAASQQLTALLTELHVHERPLPEILEEHPEYAGMVQDATHFAGGRHWRFFQQLGRQDAPAMWVAGGADALAIYGSADFVSDEADHRGIAEVVERVRPGHGRFVLLEGMDHGLHGAVDFEDALRRMSTGDLLPLDPRILDTLADWMAGFSED